MKYLVLLAVLAVVYVVWRNGRRLEQRREPPRAGSAALPQDMVRCPVCAVHLPRAEASAGSQGQLYCSHEHRVRAEG